MSRDAGNYLILVEKILGKAKEVSRGAVGDLQPLPWCQLWGLPKGEFCKAQWVIWGCRKVLLEHWGLASGDGVSAGPKCWWEQPCVSPGFHPTGTARENPSSQDGLFGQHHRSTRKGLDFPKRRSALCSNSPARRAVWMEPAFCRPSPAVRWELLVQIKAN